MKNFLSKIYDLIRPRPLPDYTTFVTGKADDVDGVVKTLTLYPYFVYSIEKNKIIGEMMLTAEQALILNQCLKKHSQPQDVSFLRM